MLYCLHIILENKISMSIYLKTSNQIIYSNQTQAFQAYLTVQANIKKHPYCMGA